MPISPEYAPATGLVFSGSVSPTLLLDGQCSCLIARYQADQEGGPEFRKSILVAIDNTPHSRTAIEWILNMQWPLDSHFTVITILPPLVDQHTDGIDVLFRQFSAERLKARREAQALLEFAAERMRRKLRTTNIALASEEGDPAETVLLTARRLAAGLIVLGARSRGKFVRWISGSVSQEIVLRAPCPVEIVKRLPQIPFASANTTD